MMSSSRTYLHNSIKIVNSSKKHYQKLDVQLIACLITPKDVLLGTLKKYLILHCPKTDFK